MSALANLVQVLEREVEQARLPGAVAYIARHGQPVLHQALGFQNPADATPMALDSLFRIYSMTKPVVSVAVLQLMEQGKLLLGDPVARYLPEFANVMVADDLDNATRQRPPRSQPTVHDLLRHTAGLTYEILGNDPIQLQYAKARLGSRSLSNPEFCPGAGANPLPV